MKYGPACQPGNWESDRPVHNRRVADLARPDSLGAKAAGHGFGGKRIVPTLLNKRTSRIIRVFRVPFPLTISRIR